MGLQGGRPQSRAQTLMEGPGCTAEQQGEGMQLVYVCVSSWVHVCALVLAFDRESDSHREI
eukprot:scaffold159538_cov18-Tisochrysis_lutea.AAC.1